MGGCCGAMKTGQKSLPDKKKSADPIQEKPNGKEVAQTTVSANDTAGKAPIDEGPIHAEQKHKDVESPSLEQIAVPVKVSVSHGEPAPVQAAAENVMDLETAVAPFESLPSSGDHSQKEAQGSITSAEPEVLLPFQIPVQHTFSSSTTTTTTTTIGHEDGQVEEFRLRVEEPQLDFAFPGDVQLSITENVQAVPPEEAAVTGDAEIVTKSFTAAEVEAVPEAGVEEAVARVERAILEAQLPVEEVLPPPPPEELEVGARFEVDGSLPVPVPDPLEVAAEPEARHDPRLMICPLERKPRPLPPRPDAGIEIFALEEKPHIELEPGFDPDIQICPLEEKPYPYPEPELSPDPNIQVCPLEEIHYPEPPRPDPDIQICPLEKIAEPELSPDPDIQICPLEEIPYPGPRPDPNIQVCPLEEIHYPEPPRPDPDIQICPLEEKPYPYPEPELSPGPNIQVCPLEEIHYPEPPRPDPDIQICPCPDPDIQICPQKEIAYPGPRPDPNIQVCPLEEKIPYPGPRPDPNIQVCPLEEIPYPGPIPGAGIQICPLEQKPYPEPGPDAGFTICPIERKPEPEEPRPEPEIAICPPKPDFEIYPESETHSEEAPSVEVPESSSQHQEPAVELFGFDTKFEEEPLQIAAPDDLPPPVVDAPAASDSLLESYEVVDASAEQFPQPPIISFTEDEQLSEQPLPNFTADTVQGEVQAPYHELLSQEPTPYQEHHHEESAGQIGDAVQSSLQEQEQPRDTTSEQLPVLEVLSDQVQESRDTWWEESGKDGQQTTATDDIPVLELVSEQVREAHQIWWDHSGAVQPEEAVTTLEETAAQFPTEQQGTSSSTETQLAEAGLPIQPEVTVSPTADGSFPEVAPVSSSGDVVVKEAEIIPAETKELPTVESPSSLDGSSSSVPTENGEVSTLSSSDENSASNLSPEGIDDPTAAAASNTKEPISTQA